MKWHNYKEISPKKEPIIAYIKSVIHKDFYISTLIWERGLDKYTTSPGFCNDCYFCGGCLSEGSEFEIVKWMPLPEVPDEMD